MKKVLFATTALVVTAGAASAEIALSGRAEMGLFGGTNVSGDPQFFTDIDVTFTMSGSTDNGLTFGAAVDLDEGGAGAAAVANNSDDGGIAIFLSGNFGTVTMGDTDGALDWALTEAAVGNAGSLNDDETEHAGYLGSYGDGAYDGQILRYDNTFGDFGVAVSVEQDNAGVRDPGYAVGFRYSLDLAGASIDLGLGYQTFTTAAGYLPGNMDAAFIGPYGAGTDIDVIGVSASTTLDNGLSAGIQYSEWDENVTGGFTHIGIGAGYTIDAITVSANWGMYDGDNPALWQVEGYGVAAAYDLGGGASIHAGWGTSEYFNGATEFDTWSFGVAMSF